MENYKIMILLLLQTWNTFISCSQLYSVFHLQRISTERKARSAELFEHLNMSEFNLITIDI